MVLRLTACPQLPSLQRRFVDKNLATSVCSWTHGSVYGCGSGFSSSACLPTKCVNVDPQRRTWRWSSEPTTRWTLPLRKIPTPSSLACRSWRSGSPNRLVLSFDLKDEFHHFDTFLPLNGAGCSSLNITAVTGLKTHKTPNRTPNRTPTHWNFRPLF